MSQADVPTDEELPERPRKYRPGTGSDRYARFAEDWLQVVRTYVLDTILEALEEHQQVVAIGGNGVGKSFFVGVGGLSALYTNPDTIVHVTAGTSSTLKNNIWKPTRGLFKDAKRRWGEDNFPGRTMDGTREIRTEMAEKWYFECVSPKYPDDLEGPHNDNVIYFIEEADKPGVTADHIDSVRSTVTSQNDRVCVIANPPTDEGNVVHGLLDSDEWHTLVFPSWESQNVRIERGLDEGEEIGGLATSWKIQQDWEEYHDEAWPGLGRAIEWSTPYLTPEGELTSLKREAETLPDDSPKANPEFREDLHERWYKRRAGIVPPQSSNTWRPFSVGDVRQAYNRTPARTTSSAESCGIDVARSGDNTVLYGLHGDEARVHYDEQGTNFQAQTPALVGEIEQWAQPEIAVDATPMGANLADDLDAKFPNVIRFSNGAKAADEKGYRDCWAEGLQLVGEFLRDGGSFSNQNLREELLAAARVIQFSERSLASRGGDVVEATSKDDLKEHLGRSPDYLDALLMAVWARDAEQTEDRPDDLGW